MIPHRGILNRLLWMQEYFQITPSDAVLQKTPYTFDVSVWEFFWPLMFGARLVIAKPGGHKDNSYLSELIFSEKITTIHFVPSMLKLFLHINNIEDKCKHLNRVICSGEALTTSIVDRFYRCFNDKSISLYNLYGPTEASVDVTYWHCDALRKQSFIPIGYPISNTQIYILDDYLQPMPIDVPGVLYIGGVGLATGYLNRPELTASRFIVNPFNKQKNQRIYNTGDLACYHADGSIEFLGRIDNQVKIRGLRIELSEIENVLKQFAAIKEAIVIAQEDKLGEKRLIAYIVPKNPKNFPNISELRKFISKKLPDYMVPQVFMYLSVIPLTANGKLDYKSLPTPTRTRPDIDKAYIAPQTENEKIFSEIWCEILGLDRVGVNDNFFELGGDSMKILQSIVRLNQKSIQLSIQHFFQYPTIDQLIKVSHYEKVEHTVTHPFSLISKEDLGKIPVGIEDAYPMTMLQRGMVFHNEFSKESHFYQVVMSFHIRGPLDNTKFESALIDIMKRHFVLRTAFDVTNFSEPMQLIYFNAKPPISFLDIMQLSKTQQENKIEELIKTEVNHFFAWDQAPLFRTTLCKVSEDEFYFLISYPDAILDGWSASSLTVEIFNRYSEYVKEQVSALKPSPAVTYRDFVSAELAAIKSPTFKDFWINKTQNSIFNKIHRWPVSYKNGLAYTFSDDYEITIPKGVYDGLKKLAVLAGTPIKHVLLAAHLKLLSILTNHDDITTGLVANGRIEKEGGDQCLGNHLNTIPFRMKLTSGNWLELIKNTFSHEQECLPYRRFPNSYLQLRQHNNQLYETGFNYTHFHAFRNYEGHDICFFLDGKLTDPFHYVYVATFRTNEWNVHNAAILKEDARAEREKQKKYEKECGLSSELVVALNYNDNEISYDQIKSIGECYQNVLTTMVNQPYERHDFCCLLTNSEKEKISDQWNQNNVKYPNKFVHEIFSEQAKKTPDSIAVITEDDKLTYRELDERSNQLANFLQSLSTPKQNIAVCMYRSKEMVIALLGILKSGNAYVSIDPSYPNKRKEYILNNTNIIIQLTLKNSKCFIKPNMKNVFLDTEWHYIAKESKTPAKYSADPNNTAYIIYTSGSTGEPKGVMIPHKGFLNRLLWMQDIFHLTQEDTILQKTPYTFDVSVWELFWPLMFGAKLVMAKPEGHKDNEYLCNIIRNERITILHFVPSMLQIFLETPNVESCNDSLRAVVCSGEELSLLLQNKFFSRFSSKKVGLYNLYGPTEASIDVSYYKCDPHSNYNIVPIGRPITNTQLYILGNHMQLLPIGVPGILYIGGDGLATGYVNQKNLTAERFISNPFCEGYRIYNTGDLACYLPDGNIQFLGRNDNQVKIRGFRIELDEIRIAINNFPTVKNSVVITHKDQNNDNRLVAYLVVDDKDRFPTVKEMREFLSNILPEYMVPSLFIKIDKIPTTTHGKLDYNVLAQPVFTRPELDTKLVLPTTENEKILVEVWSDLLGVKNIGIFDNFFELGGDSIMILQCVFKVQQKGIKLDINQIYRMPTIAKLAKTMIAIPQQNSYNEIAEGIVPLAPTQARFFAQNYINLYHWNASFMIECLRKIDPKLLLEAIDKLQFHHDAFRLRFRKTKDGWQQYYDSHVQPVPILTYDVSNYDAITQRKEMIKLADKEQASLNLERGPVAKILYFNLGSNLNQKMLFIFHHLIVDAYSIQILIEDLNLIYKQLLEKSQSIKMPNKTTSFKKWAEGMQQVVFSKKPDNDLSYWLTLPWDQVQTLSFDFNKGVCNQKSIKKITFTLDQEKTHILTQELPKRFGIKVFPVLLATLLQSFRQVTGQSNLLINVAHHGRETPFEQVDLTRTMGWFQNISPILLSSKSKNNLSIISDIDLQTQNLAKRGISYNLLGYLCKDATIREKIRELPVARIYFNYAGKIYQDQSVNKWFRIIDDSIGERQDQQCKKMPLRIFGWIINEQLSISWEYSKSLYKESTIRNLVNEFSAILIRTLTTNEK